MKLVTIAISGLHGTGKTTAAKSLADKLGLRLVSAGSVFREMAEERDMSLTEFSGYVEEHPEIDREIDKRTAEESKKDNVLLDARLSGWMAQGADLRILLTAPFEERVQRIADRDERPYDEVMEETISREASEEKRYRELYDIDVNDYSVFDLILDTGKFDKEQMIEILEFAIKTVSE